MTPPLHQLAIRIRSELKDVARILQRVEEGWERARRSSDDYYLDGVVLNLHGFYGGLERLFERIAVLVDDARPAGPDWHQTLLQQMAQEVPGVRPAVISESARATLDAYRSFRHVAKTSTPSIWIPPSWRNSSPKRPVALRKSKRNCWPLPICSNSGPPGKRRAVTQPSATGRERLRPSCPTRPS